jgi:hypothetical protein
MKRNFPQNFDANVLKPESAINEDAIKNAVKQCEDESILLSKTVSYYEKCKRAHFRPKTNLA